MFSGLSREENKADMPSGAMTMKLVSQRSQSEPEQARTLLLKAMGFFFSMWPHLPSESVLFYLQKDVHNWAG